MSARAIAVLFGLAGAVAACKGEHDKLTSRAEAAELAAREQRVEVQLAKHGPGAGSQCEFEGIAFDPATESLLLPCKTIRVKKLKDQLVIHRWMLQGKQEPRFSMVTIPLSRVIGSNVWTELHPSDITIDPASGDYVLVASKEKALIELTPSGDVVPGLPLPGQHEQAEGVAITRDSVLIVSDEARNGADATITLYRWPLTAPTPGHP